MTDTVTRLTAALADRYRIERELGQGGMATPWPLWAALPCGARQGRREGTACRRLQ
ncbi:MAG: hypothetical protein H0W15_04755 [Gemmatimonadales bacterium]|nr:hypothetical protein [Gemmatimonadales bacterium]